jgi:hypothetical protein
MAVSSLFVDRNEFLQCREVLDSGGEEKGFLSNARFKLKRKDGSVFYAKHDALSLDDEQGIHICWVCVISHLRDEAS